MSAPDPEDAAGRAERWLLSGIGQIGDLLGPSDKQVFRKLKATTEILWMELHANPRPSPSLVSALGEVLSRANAGGALLRHFWDHLDLDTLARCTMGLMVELGLVAGDDPLMRATCGYLDGCYHERFPFRSLETAYLSRLFKQGRAEDPAHDEPHEPHETRAFLGHLVPRTVNDEYGLTHALFYLTDLGRRRSASPLPEGALALRLEKLCAEALMVNNLDILAEHLLCLRHLGREDAPLSRWYGQQLCARIEAEGYFRGPVSLATTLEKEGFASDSLTFFESYHTTLLTRVFLCGLDRLPMISRWQAREPLASARRDPPPPTSLGRALAGEAGEEADFIALLKEATTAHQCLMVYLQMLRIRRARNEAAPPHPQLVRLVRGLAGARPSKVSPRIGLIGALARSVISVVDAKVLDDGEALLHQIEQGYGGAVMSAREATPSKAARVAGEYACAAAAVCALTGRRLPPSLRGAMQGALGQALRARDLDTLCSGLWAHAVMDEPIDEPSRDLLRWLLLGARASLRSPPAALEICEGLSRSLG